MENGKIHQIQIGDEIFDIDLPENLMTICVIGIS